MSIQPMGDKTQMSGTNINSGNPAYVDASAGPQATTPNARPHAMYRKQKNKKNPESKTFSYDEAGYVQTPIPKQCVTCEYFQQPNICNLPMDQSVDAQNGCCNFWEPRNADIVPLESKTMSQTEKFCRGCSSRYGEDVVTCKKCGSMEWTDKPMSNFTINTR